MSFSGYTKVVLSCTCGIKLWSYGSIIDFGYKYPKIFKVHFFEYFLDIHIQKSTLSVQWLIAKILWQFDKQL